MKLKTKKQKLVFTLLAVADLVLVILIVTQIVHPFIHISGFRLLQPKGYIAQKERTVIFTAVLLMLIVVAPVLTAAFVIARKYRAENNANYEPNWQGNWQLQFLWWAFPATIIGCLGVLTW